MKDAQNLMWSVEVLVDETEDETRAEAILALRGERLAGQGTSRRNPRDPAVPKIGEELAIARALSDLSHKLLEAATTQIEQYEGHRIKIHT